MRSGRRGVKGSTRRRRRDLQPNRKPKSNGATQSDLDDMDDIEAILKKHGI